MVEVIETLEKKAQTSEGTSELNLLNEVQLFEKLVEELLEVTRSAAAAAAITNPDQA